MKTIPRPAVLLSLAFILATAGLAQTPPPPPAPSGGIPSGIPVEAWQEFKHEAGNFAVMMPGKPLEISQTVETEIGKVPIHSFIASGGRLNYAVMYAEYPMVFDTPDATKTLLDNGRDLMLSSKNGKLIGETNISFGKYPGRELKAKIDEGTMRLRMYAVNQRMYMLMVMTPGADVLKQLESKKVNDFLASLKFLREPQPAEGSLPSMSQVDSEIDKLDLPPDFGERPVSWREVASPELGFTIWMPSEPFRKKIPLNPNDQRLDINLWMAGSGDSIYQVIAQPMLAAPSSEEHRKILFRNLLDGILNNGELKLENEKSISFEGHPGREYKLRGGAEVGTGRAYIIGSNIYILLVLAGKKSVKNKDDSAGIARFLDSFRLTKDPDAAPAIGSVSEKSATWREITEPGHGFKILLPGEPKKESSILIYSLISAGDGLVCMVTRQRLPSQSDSQSQRESFYKSFINGFAQSGGAEIAGETNIVLDGHEGREYRLKKDDKTGVIRVFLIGSDAYAISAIEVLPGTSAKSVSTFLDSFKLIEKSPKDEFAEPPPPPAPAPLPARKEAISISGGVLQASAIKRVEPVYPPIARAANAQGAVRIQITISEEGKVIEAEAIEGHPLLRDAALQAARQWEFKPTELSGILVKVQGILIFNFTLK